MIRPLILLAFWICLFMSHICSAQAQEFGFLNLINMVPTHPPCEVMIDDKELMPGGLKACHATGWFIVPQGSYRMTLKIKGMENAKGAITIAPHTSTLCVIFLQQLGHHTDPNGKPIPPKIRIKRLQAQKTSRGRTLDIVSLCPERETFHIGGKPFALKPFDHAAVPEWSGAAWHVEHHQKSLGQCHGGEEKGHYTLLLASNHSGAYAALMLRTDPQELPPWMLEKKP